MPSLINVPNFFTLLRLLLVPLVIQAILGGRHFLALALFAAAAWTDVLDGAAARHLGSSTQAGAYFDPIADKCLLSGVYLALAAAHIMPWWFVIMVFARDLCILLAVTLALLFTPIRKFPPSFWGKASTFLQIATAVVWMTQNLLDFPPLGVLASQMLWLCAAATVWSGVHYAWRGIRLTRAH